ncbi:DUF2141 domain-containing protein [Sphingomonas sp. IC-56]|uniref:DUF2141 domain-containing protein n=1 Tax=Sphingomonas sp. IC-56 TaxID=2898529 RepID=UPI001E350973|nr:DUF2141 domain-containing protein [Sphingomonas sp. IC-56]MCD2323876.1 DUF2141 domain-containing protein [Sphingomonas sp. IC-56]
MNKVLLALAALSITAAAPAPDGDVTVTVTGVKAKGGTLRVGLYTEPTFLRAAPPHMTSAPVSAAGDVTVTFHGVPKGDYAATALHDADNDNQITMGTDGRMAEGTALSRSEELKGMPTFDAAKIAVPASGASIRIAMSYPEDRTGW